MLSYLMTIHVMHRTWQYIKYLRIPHSYQLYNSIQVSFYTNFDRAFCKLTVGTLIRCRVLRRLICMGGSRGGGGGAGGPDPPENHKSVGFLSKTGPDPLKNHKAT